MLRVKVIIACTMILVMLTLSQAAWAQNQPKDQMENVAYSGGSANKNENRAGGYA